MERRIMKTLRISLLLAVTALLVVSAPAAFAGDKACSQTCGKTCGTYADALAKAKAAGQPLVLDFFTEW